MRLKPLSSFSAGVMVAYSSRRYSCTTSSPSYSPVFLTSNETSITLSKILIFRLLYSKSV